MAIHIELDHMLSTSVCTQCNSCADFSRLTTTDFEEGGNLFNLGRAADHIKKAPGHEVIIDIKPINVTHVQEEVPISGGC